MQEMRLIHMHGQALRRSFVSTPSELRTNHISLIIQIIIRYWAEMSSVGLTATTSRPVCWLTRIRVFDINARGRLHVHAARQVQLDIDARTCISSNLRHLTCVMKTIDLSVTAPIILL